MYLKVSLALMCLLAYAYGSSSTMPKPSKSCCPCMYKTPTREPTTEPRREPTTEPEREPKKEPESEGEPPEAWYGMLGGLLAVFVIATVVLVILLMKTKKQLKEVNGYPMNSTTKVAAQDLPPPYVKS